MYIVLYFISGAFAANGLPHFVKGITGEKHMTPFAKPSSAVINVLWGAFNFAVAWLIWHWAGSNVGHFYRYAIAFGVGTLVVAVSLARNWSSKR